MAADELVKKALETSKTIAIVGVSSIKKEISTNIRRRPSTIVMKYMQEFGYRVIPVNPFSAGEKIYGEIIVAKLNDISKKWKLEKRFFPRIKSSERLNLIKGWSQTIRKTLIH